MDPQLPVRVERRGVAAVVTLDRPRAANALSRDLVAALTAAFQALAADRSVRAIILTGAGDKAFCAGADLKERAGMTLDQTRAFLDQLGAALHAIETSPAPVIAALNGAAYGGGLELALACDLRLAGDHVELGLTETRLGIIPGAGGTQRLPRLIGLAAAKELILTGRRVGAEQARELGIVSQVVAAAALMATAERLAVEIAEAAPLAVEQAKRAIDAGWALPLGQALGVERAGYEIVLGSEDRDEGLRAFAEKRRPMFKGK